MNIETAEIEKAVVAQAVAALVDQFGSPDSDIAAAIETQAKKLITDRVNSAVDTAIQTVVDNGLEALIFPRTNIYGEQRKPAQTLREYIAEIVNNTFTEYVDSEGRPTNESWYRKPENQRVQKVIRDAIENKIRDEVTAAAKQIHANINHYLGEFIKIQLNEAAAKLK